MSDNDHLLLKKIDQQIREKEILRFRHNLARVVLGCLYFTCFGMSSTSWLACVFLFDSGVIFAVTLMLLCVLFYLGVVNFPYTYGTFTYSTRSFWSYNEGGYLLPGAALLCVPLGVVLTLFIFFSTSLQSRLLWIVSTVLLMVGLGVRWLTPQWEWEKVESTVYRMRFSF